MANSIIDQKSIINLFPNIIDNNKISILDIWNSFRVKVIPQLFNSEAYVDYVVKSSDRLDSLAVNFYGESQLWWIIPLVNDCEDPFDFVQDSIDLGVPIKVLRNEYVNTILFSLSRFKNASDSDKNKNKDNQ